VTAFAPGKPVTTPAPTVSVDGGLPVGDHVFQLVVIDDAGSQSQPTRVVVKIVPPVPTGPGVGPRIGGTPPVQPAPPAVPRPVVTPGPIVAPQPPPGPGGPGSLPPGSG
jgi:hypothetical protein